MGLSGGKRKQVYSWLGFLSWGLGIDCGLDEIGLGIATFEQTIEAFTFPDPFHGAELVGNFLKVACRYGPLDFDIAKLASPLLRCLAGKADHVLEPVYFVAIEVRAPIFLKLLRGPTPMVIPEPPPGHRLG